MVKYIFKRKGDKPDLTQKTSSNEKYGGVRLIYTIYKVYYSTICKKEIIWWKRNLGKKTFLRPYKKFWDKRTYRLPYAYWGKKSHPLTRLWVVIPNNYPLGVNRIAPEESLIHQHVKLFGYNFKSKDISSQLFGYKDKFTIVSI